MQIKQTAIRDRDTHTHTHTHTHMHIPNQVQDYTQRNYLIKSKLWARLHLLIYTTHAHTHTHTHTV